MPGAGEDDTIKHQQNLDLGKPAQDDAPQKIDGSVKGPIERLEKSVTSDGFLVNDEGDGLPDSDDEAARKRAVDKAKAPSDATRHRL